MDKRQAIDGSSQNKRKKVNNVECASYFDFLSQPPTLVHAASVSIAITLWTQAGMREFIKSHNLSYNSEVQFQLEYCRLEERALKSVNDLPLPAELKLNITHCMMPIGLQLQQGIDRCEKAFVRFRYLHKGDGIIHWNMEGVIDQVKSFEELVGDDGFIRNDYHIFRIACKYCSEKSVTAIWNRVPSKRLMIADDFCKNFQLHLEAYWAAFLLNKVPGLLEKLLNHDNQQMYRSDLSVYENMVSYSIFLGNPFALKYFWNKLSHHEKYTNIENWVTKIVAKVKRQKYVSYQTCEEFTDMLWFLLSQITDSEMQKQIFDAHSKVLLRSLLFHWPFQRYFLPAMIKVMKDIHIDVYAAIMKDLILQIKEGRMTGDLFRTIWHHSPLKLQDHFLFVINRKPKPKLFMVSSLLLAGDIQTICILLKKESVGERKSFATELIQYNLRRLIQSNKLAYADVLLSKLLSHSDIGIFKLHIMATYANEFCCDCLRKLNYKAAEQLLSWGFESHSEIRNFKRNQLDLKEIFISLILFGDFDYVDRFFDWCFESEEEVRHFKENFMSEDNIFYIDKLLFRLSNLDEEGWLVFERCIYYCCSSPKPEGIAKLKKLLLKEVGHIVEEHNLEFASLLLNWCLESENEIHTFKKELLLSRRGIDSILKTMQVIPNWSKTKELLDWFYPITDELVEKLKYTLITKKFKCVFPHYTQENRRRALFYLLDFYVENYNENRMTVECFIKRESSWEQKLNNILEKGM